MSKATIIASAAMVGFIGVAGAQAQEGVDKPVGGGAGGSRITGSNGTVKAGDAVVSTKTGTVVNDPNAKGTTANGPDAATGADNGHGNSGAGGGVSPAGQ